jgi:deazaflavin-dependent oxidoreductase (nitroreductase family)
MHKSPLIRVGHSGVDAAVASAAGASNHPSWYFNALANPRVCLQDGSQAWEVTAWEAQGEERVLWWHRAVERFPGYVEYQGRTGRLLPVLLLEPSA